MGGLPLQISSCAEYRHARLTVFLPAAMLYQYFVLLLSFFFDGFASKLL